MRQVATTVTVQMIDAATSMGWRVKPDWEGAGLDIERLRAPRGWISWDEYVRAIEALGGPGAAPADYAELGTLIMAHSANTPFRHVGRLVGGLAPLITATYGWIMQSTMPAVHATVHQLDGRRLQVVLELEPGLNPGAAFFYSTQGTMQRLPSVFGLPDAIVRIDLRPGAATYDITLPESQSLYSRLQRRWSDLWDRNGQQTALEHMRVHVASTIESLRVTNERLTSAEGRWRALVEGLPGMVAVLDTDGRIVELHGSAVPASVRLGEPWASLFVSEDESRMAELLRRRPPAPVAAPIDVRTALPGEGVRWWACRVGALPGDGARIVVVALDVTERRRAEELLRDSEHRFLHAQKMEAIGRLSSGLAHDINNMLTAVQGNAEILRRKMQNEPLVVSAASDILDAVGRASALTRRLLTSGRPRAGKESGVDLGVHVSEARTLLRRVIGEDVTLVTALADLPMPVTLDESRLEQIIVNLAVNARDAMRGGGRVTLSADLTEDGQFAVLTVTDDGVGMPPEVLARATEAFFTTKPMGLGSGLGLATVRDIVEGARGQLEIDSDPGLGTTVRVRLPLATAAPPPLYVPPAAARRGTGQHVLLVEDQAEVREMVEQMLEMQGYRVHAFPSATAALETVLPDLGGIDVLVTDIVMPGMSGRTLARALRERRPDLPVVLMSGYTDEDTEDLGGTTPHIFLAKPFSMTDLSGALQRLLPTSVTP